MKVVEPLHLRGLLKTYMAEAPCAVHIVMVVYL